MGPRDAFVKKHSDRVVQVEGRLNVHRREGICGCLMANGGPWACAVYADRPKTCRDFQKAGINCVDARVRLGLTP